MRSHRSHQLSAALPRRLIDIFRIIFECWIRKKYSFSKVYSISPNSQVFPRNQPFSAVFAIKNIRKRDRVILVFLTERILSYDHLAKEKTQKSWKLDFWRNFKVWNFEFLVIFSIFFLEISIYFVKYAHFATRVVLWFLAVLFHDILVKKFWTYHQNWKLYKQYFKILHISNFLEFFSKNEII